MVKIPRFHCRGQEFDPWSGELRSHMPHGVTKKKKERKKGRKERKEGKKERKKERERKEGRKKERKEERKKERKKERGFPGGAVVENLPANAGDTGSSPGLGRSHMPRSS